MILLLATVANGAGCIIIPTGHGPRKTEAVGTAENVPLKVGQATRDDVLARLGPPQLRTDHNRAFGYYADIKTGTYAGLWYGMCAPVLGVRDFKEDDDVWLEFDEAGVLRRYEKRLAVKHKRQTDVTWRAFINGVPDTYTPRRSATQSTD